MPRPKINILFLQAQQTFGADSAVHASIMQALDRERFNLHIACNHETSGDSDALHRFSRVPGVSLIPVQFLPSRTDQSFASHGARARQALGSARAALALRDYVRRNEIHIVHSCERPRDVLYNLSLSRSCAVQSVIHVHIKWTLSYGRLPRAGVNHADAVFSISDFVSGSIRETGRKKPVWTIHNAVDTERFHPRNAPAQVRAELGLPPDAGLILSAARLFDEKGQRELIKAMPSILESLPSTRLLIAGENAPHLDYSFKDKLRELAGALGVAQHVVFLGHRADIPELLAACDVFALPSYEEPFGLVYAEAMATAKPVVALNNGGTPEVVVHGETGLLTDPWDVPGLSRDIVRLLQDRDFARKLGESGRRRVEAKFGLARLGVDAGAAFTEVARSPRSGRL